jgi:hypothetical protein
MKLHTKFAYIILAAEAVLFVYWVVVLFYFAVVEKATLLSVLVFGFHYGGTLGLIDVIKEHLHRSHLRQYHRIASGEEEEENERRKGGVPSSLQRLSSLIVSAGMSSAGKTPENLERATAVGGAGPAGEVEEEEDEDDIYDPNSFPLLWTVSLLVAGVTDAFSIPDIKGLQQDAIVGETGYQLAMVLFSVGFILTAITFVWTISFFLAYRATLRRRASLKYRDRMQQQQPRAQLQNRFPGSFKPVQKSIRSVDPTAGMLAPIAKPSRPSAGGKVPSKSK